MSKDCRFVSSARLEGRLARFMLETSKEVREDRLPTMSSCEGRSLTLLGPVSERYSSDVKLKICEGSDERLGL